MDRSLRLLSVRSGCFWVLLHTVLIVGIRLSLHSHTAFSSLPCLHPCVLISLPPVSLFLLPKSLHLVLSLFLCSPFLLHCPPTSSDATFTHTPVRIAPISLLQVYSAASLPSLLPLLPFSTSRAAMTSSTKDYSASSASENTRSFIIVTSHHAWR